MSQDEDFKDLIDLMKLRDHFTFRIETEPIEFEPVPNKDLGILPGEIRTFQHEISREYVSDFEQVYNRELSIYFEKDKTLYESGFVEYEIKKISDLVSSIETGLKNIQDNDIFKKAKNYILFLMEKSKKVESREPIKSKGLSLSEIALICIYTKQHIDSTSAKQILNYFNPNLKSEKKLIDRYNYYQLVRNRIGEGVEKNEKNRERLLMKVVSYLETNEFEATKAINELQSLSASIKARY